ncbi:hypothetical protein CHUAL_005886 [Chamberlinius hualienensis]
MKDKLKRRHNWKSRQVHQVEEDNSEVKKIKLDLPGVNTGRYDESNTLVLPSKKRKTKIKVATEVKVGGKLSNKRRKMLQKIVAAKNKKRNRAELLEALAKLQGTEEENKMYLSTSDAQTKGLKKCLASTLEGSQLKSVKGSRKKINLEPKSDSSPENSENSDSSEVSSDDESTMEVSENKTDSENQEKIQQDECAKVQNESKTSTVKTEVSSKETKPTESTACKNSADRKPSKFRPVNRLDEIQKKRLLLPILAEEQVVMEAINENSVVIICGETGSGKTTQVPQFLYEAGYTTEGRMIGVTEPRRVAAITMSQRVALEMNLPSEVVSYQIRYEGNSTDKTEIKFMTDGVLLKEMQTDFLLSKYSVIVVDEAHERSVFTDILIALLSRIVPLREKKGNPLKLVIMSATLKVEDFTENRYLFVNKPPVINVQSRQFSVNVHFNRRTNEDYVNEAYRKACKIHRQMPDGGILIFVTGQREVNLLCNKLRRTFPVVDTDKFKTGEDENDEDNKDQSPDEKGKYNISRNSQKTAESLNDTIVQKINLDDYSAAPMEETNEENEFECDSELGDELSDNEETIEHGNKQNPEPPIHVLPLYSFLPSNKQSIVFQPPPSGCRLCVVATNVAETSITIPNIKYVIDTGKVKMRLYDKVTGVSTFRVMWASKASSDQRAGRAGRTSAGHCYRLFSSALFNDEFEQFSRPEICRRPIDDVVLLLKAMDIDKVLKFPFPTPVDGESIKASERRLTLLGALKIQKTVKKAKTDEEATILTPLGKAISCFPVAPRYGKMLALSNQHGLLPYVVAITSSLTVNELLHDSHSALNTDEEKEVINNNGKKWLDIRRTWAGLGNSLKLGDVMVLLKAVGACEFVGCNQFYCEKHGIHYKSMVEVRKLRMQLTNAINLAIPNANLCIDPKMPPPTDIQCKFLRQIMLAGLPDNVARRVLEGEVTGDADTKRKWKHAYRSSYIEEPIFLNPSSILFQDLPEFVVYQEIFEGKKMYMKGVTVIEPEWLITFCPTQCTLSNPMTEPEPRFDPQTGTLKCFVTATFGKCGWELPASEVDFPEGLERMRWFARFLLNGEVFPKLAKYVTQLMTPPATMTKSWSRLQPRTELMLNSLRTRNVYSKETLMKEWEKDNLCKC